MVGLRHVLGLLGLSTWGLGVAAQSNATDWPVHSNGLTNVVEWYALDSLASHEAKLSNISTLGTITASMSMDRDCSFSQER